MNTNEFVIDKLKVAVSLAGVIAFFLTACTLMSCSNDSDALPAPIITSFTPAFGLPGGSITIVGKNFSNTLVNNKVTINGIAANVTSATSEQLVVNIPINATTGKIAIALSNHTVTTSNDFEVLKDIPRTGLIAFYPFTGNGDCTNNDALNLNFSLTGAPTLVNDRHNRPSQALGFNGTSQYSEIFKEVIPGQPFTISFWMDPGNLTLYDHEIMTSYFSNTGYDITLRVDNNDASKYYINVFHVGPAGVTNLSPTTSYLPSADAGDTWISISMTFDGTTFKIFRDGIEIISNSVTTAIPLIAGQRFGIGGDEVKHFNGKLDDIAIYNRTLNPTEIMTLFHQTVSKY